MRTKRSIIVPAAGAAVLLAAGLALIVPGSSPHGAAHSPAGVPTAAPEPPAAGTTASATTTPATATAPPTSEAPSPEATATTATPAAQLPSGAAAAGDGPQGDPAIQAALNAQHPSDLPAETAEQLSALARAVWTAEATGEGRQRWPDYFPAVQGAGGRPYFYTGFRVQAAIAHTAKGDREHAAVDLLWAGTSPTGEYGDHRPATLSFTLVNGTWEPRR
ncbi:hypothetical protein ABT093_19940 [Kitasatospora sp. NPDC002551]|uniref:hypothetical protein n=1 Tax=Kitasatospora sp. NPDC002551 TaxID=3154539 RepID=UPI003324ABAC